MSDTFDHELDALETDIFSERDDGPRFTKQEKKYRSGYSFYKIIDKGGRMRQGYEGGGRSREKKVEIRVFWASGEVDSFICKEPNTIQQRYKQLNFIEHTGEAVAINLHQTKYVKVDDENIDFNDIAQT